MYRVGVPWQSNGSELPNNYKMALKRLKIQRRNLPDHQQSPLPTAKRSINTLKRVISEKLAIMKKMHQSGIYRISSYQTR